MIIFMLKSRDNFGLVVVGGDLFAVGGSVAIGSQVGRGNDDDSIDDYDYEHDSNYDDFFKRKSVDYALMNYSSYWTSTPSCYNFVPYFKYI